jgi:hypothetical protein
MIRKGEKSGIEWNISDDRKDLDFLIDTHRENVGKLGGIYKDKNFFEIVIDNFLPGKEYKLFVAYLDGRPIAALLLFYFNKTVEYFTPVIKEEYRSLQPLSKLIYEGMKDALKDGYKHWNWGGTWKAQEGVYRFKKRWGTSDYPYFYYTKIYDKGLLDLSKEELLSEYPHFFVLPFDKLNS